MKGRSLARFPRGSSLLNPNHDGLLAKQDTHQFGGRIDVHLLFQFSYQGAVVGVQGDGGDLKLSYWHARECMP